MRDFTTTVAGVSRNQSIVEQCSEGDEVYLIREPDNKYDPNAIIVHSSEGETSATSHAREQSVLPQSWMEEPRSSQPSKKITGGFDDKPTMGIVLSVSESAVPRYGMQQSAADTDIRPWFIATSAFLVLVLLLLIFT